MASLTQKLRLLRSSSSAAAAVVLASSASSASSSPWCVRAFSSSLVSAPYSSAGEWATHGARSSLQANLSLLFCASVSTCAAAGLSIGAYGSAGNPIIQVARTEASAEAATKKTHEKIEKKPSEKEKKSDKVEPPKTPTKEKEKPAEKKPAEKNAVTNGTKETPPKSISELHMTIMHRQRRVMVTGRVNEEMAKSVVAQLLYLESVSATEPVTLIINSGGGSVTDGLAIVDAMGVVSYPIRTVAVGRACSMAAIILSCGAQGKRLVAPNARVMLHQPSHGLSGTTSDILISAAEAERTRARLVGIVAKQTGRSAEEVQRLMDRDQHFSADESVRFGIADDVLTSKFGSFLEHGQMNNGMAETREEATTKDSKELSSEKSTKSKSSSSSSSSSSGSPL
ncbi:hypothetical protein PPROV_000976300 [Pycnococcus provasolii]|uniref:ATP-dependent Clp protease proteolytic subunit n=1 Tax=Pycnococcus provasolii TaxID=41880 RepID=A0A830HW99_9CHLO|nr:hypothetical protein PPROV_000976300 [Pycnococcus provasolii]|mmetsp:Transcript_87/g.290  ORF Transcript_87/g.290 Transcript_87/m.290 type:complete len:397 (-) Transcript_87:80-1270(-)|eukprot:CAMPEP_0205958532 /NCGR_PEP_ID=MMETSP1459-20131121/50533_1 /ASSEMBLY_ACC=CAM_ASM_001120 /TAXON_ID=41880 /ORGANISM="Pycnococcus provasolii, Strain RCC931" /LENGTH=396 /DNA_ID=CAMNT_0053331071 /DNA_START=110 /DNA_END=1300 /DNA_ORIENTATION=+